MVENPLSLNAKQSLIHHVGRSIVPLAYLGNEQVDILGTGTLIAWRGYKLIVGAGHSLRDDPMGALAVPSNSMMLPSEGLCILKPIDVWRTIHSEKNGDISIIDVSRSWLGKTSNHGYHFIDIDKITIADPSDHNPGWYFLIGYPQSRTYSAGNQCSMASITMTLNPISGAPDQFVEFTEGTDLFFTHTKEVINLMPDGSRTVGDSPRLGGISGTSIWKFSNEATGGFWHPSEGLSIVGIQVAYRHGSYVRATNWRKVMEVLNHHPCLRDEEPGK